MTYKPKLSIKSLLEVGAHFGHKKNLWNPEMEKYIYGVKNKIHIIDLQQTAYCFYNTLQAVFNISSRSGRILFVNTKKQSTDIVKEEAVRCGQYYVNHRWLGGMLTNWSTVSSSIKTLKKYEEILDNQGEKYTKKELLNFARKKEKLEKAIGGIRNLGGLPDLLFVIDVKMHSIAIEEANKLGIPIMAIVDTNSSPKGVDFVIPGNDDSRKSIAFYCNLVADASLAGLEQSLSLQGVDIQKLPKSDTKKEDLKKT